ncbi:hypothetical protein CC80DRAFT_530747 [Byssothecium circinans]|uniref:Uncharacterized protein n=1 Tax=Byssothecium circinans TaxID=147558 RepID=A0A6A5UIU8_9PLEO|nr:hypothetical protein CC80DRAFT_530747 [Byssothecium circinans]
MTTRNMERNRIRTQILSSSSSIPDGKRGSGKTPSSQPKQRKANISTAESQRDHGDRRHSQHPKSPASGSSTSHLPIKVDRPHPHASPLSRTHISTGYRVPKLEKDSTPQRASSSSKEALEVAALSLKRAGKAKVVRPNPDLDCEPKSRKRRFSSTVESEECNEVPAPKKKLMRQSENEVGVLNGKAIAQIFDPILDYKFKPLADRVDTVEDEVHDLKTALQVITRTPSSNATRIDTDIGKPSNNARSRDPLAAVEAFNDREKHVESRQHARNGRATTSRRTIEAQLDATYTQQSTELANKASHEDADALEESIRKPNTTHDKTAQATNSTIAQLKREVDLKANKKDVERLGKTSADAKTQHGALEAKVDSMVVSKADCDTVKELRKRTREDCEALRRTISLLPTKKQYDTLKDTVTSTMVTKEDHNALARRVKAARVELNSLPAKEEVDALALKVEAVQAQLTSPKSSIGSDIEKIRTEIGAENPDHATQLSELHTELDQKANCEVFSKLVNQTLLTAKFALDIQKAGTDLAAEVRNGKASAEAESSMLREKEQARVNELLDSLLESVNDKIDRYRTESNDRIEKAEKRVSTARICVDVEIPDIYKFLNKLKNRVETIENRDNNTVHKQATVASASTVGPLNCSSNSISRPPTQIQTQPLRTTDQHRDIAKLLQRMSALEQKDEAREAEISLLQQEDEARKAEASSMQQSIVRLEKENAELKNKTNALSPQPQRLLEGSRDLPSSVHQDANTLTTNEGNTPSSTVSPPSTMNPELAISIQTAIRSAVANIHSKNAAAMAKLERVLTQKCYDWKEGLRKSLWALNGQNKGLAAMVDMLVQTLQTLEGVHGMEVGHLQHPHNLNPNHNRTAPPTPESPPLQLQSLSTHRLSLPRPVSLPPRPHRPQTVFISEPPHLPPPIPSRSQAPARQGGYDVLPPPDPSASVQRTYAGLESTPQAANPAGSETDVDQG